MRATSWSRPRTRRRTLLAELKKGAAFDKLAKEKSTDKASGAEGGDLGWFKSTDMVKEFADAAFDAEEGRAQRDAGQDPVRLPRHQGRGPPQGAAAGVRGDWPTRSARSWRARR